MSQNKNEFEGGNMKPKAKSILLISLLILSVLSFLFAIYFEPNNSQVYAASGSQSDLQLMARAINGEARGEPYEGQVAVRSRHPKPSEKFTISQYHSRSHL